MNWEAIGAIAEIMGSVAVIVTLALLILQLRSNTVMIKNQTAQNSANSISAWSRQLTGNPDLYRLYRAGLKDDSALSKEDRGRFDMIIHQVFQDVYGMYTQYLNVGLDKARWEAQLRTLGVIYNTPGGRATWERQKFIMDPSFQKEVEQHFANRNAPNEGQSPIGNEIGL
jgi:hypothetical protein